MRPACTDINYNLWDVCEIIMQMVLSHMCKWMKL
jgi:hypothetical protein